MKIGILGAMEPEVKSLYEKLENSCIKKIGSITFYEGTLFNKSIVIVKCGIGKVNASLCTQLLISNFNITHLVNTGIAGSMAEGLGIFDFVLSQSAFYHDVNVTAFGYKLGQIPGMDLEFKSDEKLLNTAKIAFELSQISKEHKMIIGKIASGDQFISGGEQKAFIKKTFNPACVEMEGAAIAHTAIMNNIPFLIIRCMSDMADDNIKSVYNFNEDEAAKISASFVKDFIKEL